MDKNEFDVIIIGSGASGATLARELANQDLKVLILERGADNPMGESLADFAAMARELPVGDGMKATTAYTAGGSTSIYFGISKMPTSQTYEKLGIDLTDELEEVSKELPIAEVSDDFLSPQTIMVRESARQLGYPMKVHSMLIDKSLCTDGHYSYEAKWKARTYLAQAQQRGAVLATKARVQRIIVENGNAIGVEYLQRQGFLSSKLCKVYGKKIVLSAGSPATPKLLIDAGVDNVGSRGFFCKPAFMVFGSVSGLQGRDAFLGLTECDLGNGVTIGDGAMPASLFKLFMLSNLKFRHVTSHATTVSVAVALNDELGGEINESGRYSKQLTSEETTKLKEAEEIAMKILGNAGATNLFRSRTVAGTPGGVLWVGEHLDENLQTSIRNLYVCDQSVMPDVRITPLIMLVCLAKRLARHLAHSLRERETIVERVTAVDAVPITE